MNQVPTFCSMRTEPHAFVKQSNNPKGNRAVLPNHSLSPTADRIYNIFGSIVTIALLLVLLCSAMYVLLTPGCESALIDLQDLAVVFRHGERFRAVPRKLKASVAPGDLTSEGQEQISKLGNKLRHQYRSYFSRVRQGRLVSFNGTSSKNSSDIFMQAIGLDGYDAIQIPVDVSLRSIRDRRKIFDIGVLECLENIGVPQDEVDQKIVTYFRSLCKIVIADSLDMIQDITGELPPNFEQPRGIRESFLLTPEVYKTMTDSAINTFAKPGIKKFIDEIRSLRRYAGPPSMLAFSLSNVGISGFLDLINPEKTLDGRPGYGAHLLFNFFQDDVEVFYAPDYEANAEHWLTREPLGNFLQRLTRAINIRRGPSLTENESEI